LWTSFAFKNSYENLILEIEALAQAYPGWTLTELKHMTVRERKMWVNRALAKMIKRQQHGTNG
jgi:hypothetical protein